MARVLQDAQRQGYLRDGIVSPVPVLAAGEVVRFRAACDDLEARLGGRPRTVEVRQMHLHFRFAFELATQVRVLDAVEDVLGPDLLIWATELFAKHPRDGSVSIGWHRDRPYMGLAAPASTTAWIALSDSLPENGCMRAIPGPDRATVPVDNARAVDVCLRAGEMSLHDGEILHGSSPNRSDQKRVGFAVRFVTPDAQPLVGRPPVLRARGRSDCPRFQIVDPPSEADFSDSSTPLAGMKRSAALHLDAILANLAQQES